MGNKLNICEMPPRKGKTSSLNKNKLKTKYHSKFEKYKCKIKKDETEFIGFFCNLGNSNQNIFIPTIITKKDSFNENFAFDGHYSIKIYNNNDLPKIYLKKMYLSDKHNIVILQILDDNFIMKYKILFLEIPNYDIFENMSHYSDNEQYLLFYLKKEEIKFLECVNINVDKKDYTFEYSCRECKDASYILIINSNRNELEGIHMKRKDNKGILIKGIVKEIQNNQIEDSLENIYNRDDKMLSQFQDKEPNALNKLPQNKNVTQNNNESFEDNVALEENNEFNKLKVFNNEKNDIYDLSKKKSIKINNNMKYNNKFNNNSSLINQRNGEKNNLNNSEKIKNENKAQNKNFIYNSKNEEKYSNKSNNYSANNQIFEGKEKKSNLNGNKNEIVEIKKQSESKNTQNGSEKSDKSNKELNNIHNNGEEISLYFVFNNGKELYLDVKDSCFFEDIIKQLYEKYLWLKNIKIKEYIINKEIICKNKTAKDNKLVNNSIINIIEIS